jgi:ribosome modulation factor
MARGEVAFHDGKTKEAIDEAGLYNLGARSAWLIGWRNAGGDISKPGHRKPTTQPTPPESKI